LLINLTLVSGATISDLKVKIKNYCWSRDSGNCSSWCSETQTVNDRRHHTLTRWCQDDTATLDCLPHISIGKLDCLPHISIGIDLSCKYSTSCKTT